ncbi:MAG: DUF2786 domain-containing protein [Oligoflexia bacterium]|nr:DUF2786 domain-containing protein [Oligoflexia bacterium]MBF0365290.1 DUF2786 domain-containing protein [Oligoflexia bacterium]
MFVYSETINAFMLRMKKRFKEILTYELGMRFSGDHFFHRQSYHYVQFAAFERSGVQQMLAYFDSELKLIAFNKLLVYSAKDALISDILRHEVAHLMVFLDYGVVDEMHGREFQAVCQRYGWNRESIMRASSSLEVENQNIVGDLESERVLDKVQKLLALAGSSNAHEAELAMLRANQLLLKHNLKFLSAKERVAASDLIYCDQVLRAKRKSAKLNAIARILGCFFVAPIFSYKGEGVSLEVTGSRTNVEFAKYVAAFLDRELERLWEDSRKLLHCGGLRARNSFMTGVAYGFKEKLQSSQQQDVSKEDSLALTVFQKRLQEDLKVVYTRITSSYSSASIDQLGLGLGKAAGKKLTIHPGVGDKGGCSPLLFLE